MKQQNVEEKDVKQKIKDCLIQGGSTWKSVYEELNRLGIPKEAINVIWLQVAKDIEESIKQKAKETPGLSGNKVYVWYRFNSEEEFKQFKDGNLQPRANFVLFGPKKLSGKNVKDMIDLKNIVFSPATNKAYIGLGVGYEGGKKWSWALATIDKPSGPEEKKEEELTKKVKEDVEKIEKDEKKIDETQKETEKDADKPLATERKLIKKLKAVQTILLPIQKKQFVDNTVTKQAIVYLEGQKKAIRALRTSIKKLINDVNYKEFVVLTAEIEDFKKLQQDVNELAMEIQKKIRVWHRPDPRADAWWQRCQIAAEFLQQLTTCRGNYLDRIKRIMPNLDEHYGLAASESQTLKEIVSDLTTGEQLRLESAIQKLDNLIHHYVEIFSTISTIRKDLKEVDDFAQKIDKSTSSKWLEDFVLQPIP
jgi:hypothetical protein